MSTSLYRAYNFNAGPAALPLPVLLKAQEEMVNYDNTGMSVMELSHRDKDYDAIHNKAISLLRELLGISDDYDIMLLQGGGSTQFAMIPYNFLTSGQQAGYVLTGAWSERAINDAKTLGSAYAVASGKENNYRQIPTTSELQIQSNTSYIHITTNNTIFGTQWQTMPSTGTIPLLADMSSDILSKPIEVNNFSMIYGGAQKNLGPSGVTVVIMKRSFLQQANTNLPIMLRYDIQAKENSLYNTPPCYSIYILSLVLQWVKEQGGVKAVYEGNQKKAALVYDVIDESKGFYRGHAVADSRSLMNVTFRLSNEDLEKQFLIQAKKEGFVGLNGHRSVGGCRASLYNAVPYEACVALQQYMLNFMKQHS